MKVLVIGSGGREHALAYGIAKNPKIDRLYCLPGNPGMERIATLVDAKVDDLDFILSFVESE